MNRAFLIVPAILLIMVTGLLPTFVIVNYSFQTPYAVENRFMGFENFRKTFYDPRWWTVWGRTLVFSGITIGLEIPLGLGLALLVYRKGKFNSFISAAIALPALLPGVTIGLMWRMMAKSIGPFNILVNTILNPMGLIYQPFRDPVQSFATIAVMDIWHWTSLVFIVMSAGLASMEEAPTLAAKTEGATRFQIFRYIELPALRFSLVFIGLIRFMDSLKIYDEAMILTGGGPGLTTEFLSLYIKRIGADRWILGYAAALSLQYLLILLLLVNFLIIVITRGRGLQA